MRLIGEGGRERGFVGGRMNGFEVFHGVEVDFDFDFVDLFKGRVGVEDIEALFSAVIRDGVSGALTSERDR
jgi:hypothetical protein